MESTAAILTSPISDSTVSSSSFEPTTPNASERDLATSTPSNFQTHIDNNHPANAHLQVDSASSAYSSKPTSVDLSTYSSNASTPTSMSSMQYSFNTNYSGGSGSLMSVPVGGNSKMGTPVFGAANKYLNIDQLRFELLKQLEYYFSKRNLSTDDYLLSQMDKDYYVPIVVIAGFKKVTQLTADTGLIVDCIRQSTQLELDPTGTKVRSIGGASGGDITVANTSNLNDLMQQQQAKQQRSKIIMREVAPEATEEQVKALFVDKEPDCAPSLQCEKAGTDSWYITFANEDQAQRALQYLKFSVVNFLEKPIKARIKSHGMPRSTSNFTPAGTPGSQQLSVSNTPPPQSIMYSSASSSAQSPSQMQTQTAAAAAAAASAIQIPYIQPTNAAFPYIQSNLPQITHQQQLIHLQATQQQQYSMLSQANPNYVHRLSSHGMAQSPNQYIVPNGQQVIAIQPTNGAMPHQAAQGHPTQHQAQWLPNQYWQSPAGAPQSLIQGAARQIDRTIVYSPIPNQPINVIPQYGIVPAGVQGSAIQPLQVQTPPVTNNNQLSPRNTPHSSKPNASPSVSPGANASQSGGKTKDAGKATSKAAAAAVADAQSPSKSSTPHNAEVSQPLAYLANPAGAVEYSNQPYNQILSVAPHHQIGHMQSPHASSSSIGTPQPYFPIQLVNHNFNNGQPVHPFYSAQAPPQAPQHHQNSIQPSASAGGQQFGGGQPYAPPHFIIQPQFGNGQQPINVSIAANPQAIHGVYNTIAASAGANGAGQLAYPYQIIPAANLAGNNVNSSNNGSSASANTQQNEAPVYFQPYANGVGYVPANSNFKSPSSYELENGGAGGSGSANGAASSQSGQPNGPYQQTVNSGGGSNGELQTVYSAAGAAGQQINTGGAASAGAGVVLANVPGASGSSQPQTILIYNHHLLQPQHLQQPQHLILNQNVASSASNLQASTSPLLVTTSVNSGGAPSQVQQQQYATSQQQQQQQANSTTTPGSSHYHQGGQSFHHNPHHGQRRGGGGGSNGAGSYSDHHQRNVNMSSRSKYSNNNQNISVLTDHSGGHQALSPNNQHHMQHSPRHYQGGSHPSSSYHHGGEQQGKDQGSADAKSAPSAPGDSSEPAGQAARSSAINSADFPPLKATAANSVPVNSASQSDSPIDPAIISISKDINSLPLSHLGSSSGGSSVASGSESAFKSESHKQTVTSLLTSLQQQHQKQSYHDRAAAGFNNNNNNSDGGFHHGLKHSNSNQLNPVNQYHHAHHSSNSSNSSSYHHNNAGYQHHHHNGHHNASSASSGYYSPNSGKAYGRKHNNHGQHQQQYEASSYGSGGNPSPNLSAQSHHSNSSYNSRYRNSNAGNRSSHHHNNNSQSNSDQSSPYGNRNRNKMSGGYMNTSASNLKGSAKSSASPPASPALSSSDQSAFGSNGNNGSEPIAIVNNISPSSNYATEDEMNLANSLGKKLTFAEIVQRQNNGVGVPVANPAEKPYKPSNLALSQQGSLSKDSSGATTSSSKSSSAVTTPTSSTTFATPSTSSLSSTSANTNTTVVGESYSRAKSESTNGNGLGGAGDDGGDDEDDEMTLSVDADSSSYKNADYLDNKLEGKEAGQLVTLAANLTN